MEFVWEWAEPYLNTWRATDDHMDKWWDTALIIEQMAGKSKFAGPGGWNDFDFLMTGGQGCPNGTTAHCPGMTEVEYMTEFSMWVIAASPLIVATDLRDLTPVMKTVLFNEEMYAIHQDSLAVAGDRYGFWPCQNTSDKEWPYFCQIWARPLSSNRLAVALYNADQITHIIQADFSLFGSQWANAQLQVRDLWSHQDLGIFNTSFAATVEGHGVRVLLWTRVGPIHR